MGAEVESGYTFRMGDHEITMRDSFASMLDSTQLTDCLLVCHSHLKQTDTDSAGTPSPLTNGHSLLASVRTGSSAQVVANNSEHILRTHRVILSASSDYFRSVFNSGHDFGHNGVIAVILTNVDFDDLKSIIDFIYKGQVSVGQSRIHKFLASAQMLMVKGLMNIKLVSNDNQPIDEHNSNDNELIQRLNNDKRVLEQEIRAIKELEKSKIDKIKRETELELKKKLEIEKSILSEEKQRFEAEKMKFTIEKEFFEKNKHKTNNSFTNNSNNISINKSINNIRVVEELSEELIEKQTNNDLNANTVQRTPRESLIKVGPQNRLSSGLNSGTNSAQKLSSTESTIISNVLIESPNVETEGRQLRKRIKLNDNESHESMSKTQTSEDMQKMETEEEDGDVYEVDFSGLQPQDMNHLANGPKVSQTLVNTTGTVTDVNSLTSTPQSAAIVASALAHYKTMTTSTITTPSQLHTRALRRSTSSLGSASTQSISGENGMDSESVSLRRKGPGRTPNWAKEPDNVSETDSPPNTRTRKQSLNPQSPIQQSTSGGGHLYSCPYCPQVYHGNQSMQDHINGVHLNSKTQYICDYCGKVYTWRISLNKHLRTAHPNEPIPPD